MATIKERLDELLSDATYSNEVQSSGLSAEAYYLKNTWDDDLLDGKAPNSDEMLQTITTLDLRELISVVPSLNVSQLGELDSAQGFDLGATLASFDPTMLNQLGIFDKMAGDMSTFQGFMNPNQMLSILGSSGDKMANMVRGMDASNLAFLNGAQGFDLGATLGGLDPTMLSGFMSGWGSGELQFLNGLGGFDLGSKMASFDPKTMASMIGSWDDPNAIGFLGKLDGFDFSAMLNNMPSDLKGDMLGQMDASMLAGFGKIGGDFDPTAFFAGTSDSLPPGFDPSTIPNGGDGDMSGDSGSGAPVTGIPPGMSPPIL